MNERIRELAQQARDWAEVSYKKQNEQFTSHWDTPIGYTVSQFFEQKLAELIVSECAEIGQQSVTRGIGMAISQHALPDYVKGKIQTHFGVEE